MNNEINKIIADMERGKVYAQRNKYSGFFYAPPEHYDYDSLWEKEEAMQRYTGSWK